ncbi:Serpentine Receptor, class T [Caenorhabditis elegans]|uniref:Serpentine Receptor, class T n=2 Tax=Caenorhabditis elegans TaxID=6239 RepID=I2HAH7_CAEEL|nr:Serpentine Receptor, class T [Caenorhabditis elegans]CCH63905.1 Serpentine Receptor, class T [Caenorhabditis elegans]|eukprot:NP_001263818.1 Uncharacterized protein CELE_Y57G11C.30 [Caenorhabditis elegans]
MNRLLEYGSVEAIPYYNCSHKNFTEWEKTGQKRPYFGWPLVVFGVLVELLYIPVIYIIFKTKLIRHPCYKLILLLALIDMSATCCSCLITGPMLIMGTVFCMYPTFTYVAGGIALNTWCMACAATMSLFSNRIISIGFRKYADVIEKKLAYTSISFVLFYGFYIYWFTPTIVYNSVFMAWIPDPLSEEVPSEEAAAMYKNTIQAWNNWVFVTCMFILFSVYFIMVKRLAKGQKSKASRSIFIQCSIICFFNTGTALIYNALAIVTPAEWILAFGQICWTCNHASPAIIYVTLNDTIRREFLKTVFRVTLAPKIEDATTSLAKKSTI